MIQYLVIAVIFAVSVTTAFVKGHSQGVHEVTAKWDADKAVRIKRTTEIVLANTERVALADEKLRAEKGIVHEHVVYVKEKASQALGPLANEHLGVSAVGLFNFATGNGSAAPPAEPRAATPAEDAATATVGDLYQTCVDNAEEQRATAKQLISVLESIDAYNADILRRSGVRR